MSRVQTGKTSLFMLWCRWYLVWMICITPFAYFAEEWRASLYRTTFISATLIAFGLIIFMRIWGRIVNNDPSYYQWLAAGGSPFWDTLAWPLNSDPPQNRAAIGTPPPTEICQACGARLGGFLGYGGNYGNVCNNCGTVNDTF